MKVASLNELKEELQTRTPKEILALCLRLAKFKKENKELLTFLLFESDSLPSYIQSVKMEMDEQFALVNKTNLYFAKKGIRKILRNLNKYIKYTSSKEAEAELLIDFCINLKHSGIALHKSTALANIFNAQLKKINTAIASLHEDLQYEYLKEIKEKLS